MRLGDTRGWPAYLFHGAQWEGPRDSMGAVRGDQMEEDGE